MLKINFSEEELVRMIYYLGASDDNCLLASRVCAERFPYSERQPNRVAFERIKERFDRTGNVSFEASERRKTAANAENEMFVMQSVVENAYILSLVDKLKGS